MHPSNILVTGANGFIGKCLCQALEHMSCNVIRGIRSDAKQPQKHHNNFDNASVFNYNKIDRYTDWNNKLHGIDHIVHLAGRVHIQKETKSHPLDAFRDVNTIGTQRLADAAAKQSVKRFIYLSSIGVNGDKTKKSPFTELDSPSPHNDYTQSKWEAEVLLHSISEATDMDIVIIRPPLVYGPGVKANFLTLLHVISKCFPLPFGKIDNLRSYISVYNLVDFILCVLNHPQAAGETFLICDDQDISTPDLIYLIADLLERPSRVLSVPDFLLNLCGQITNHSTKIARLSNSLQIDISKAKNLLDWQPPLSLSEGLKRTIMWYKDKER